MRLSKLIIINYLLNDDKWDRFYLMDDDNVVCVKKLNTYNYLREGMKLDVYDYWLGYYFFRRVLPL